MLDAETKRRIDTARDILVGKVPDPKSQVEQITIALIYKFMDDIDAESEELGGEREFFAGDFARYGWAKLMQPGIGGYEMLGLYAEAIERMPENPGIPPLFRSIFNNAYLPYRDPETLRAFLKIIDEFTYDDSEQLGDAYEYLLSVLDSQGDAGQFRTPRHIIDFIVSIIDPKKNETILDPACGTGGFLISSYKHIDNANKDDDGNSTLTPEDMGRLAASFKGYDISPDMVRLSLVNMYLHNLVDPHIFEYDTLTSEDRWDEFADVILANPPFMSPKGGIRPHNRFSVQSRRSEVLFVDYMAEHLTPSGRAGIIVPEGIIFQSQNAHKQLRKMLVEDYLVAVVSLPAGVFNPYSGVKTSILILDKSLARKTDSIAFFKVENDGFDLGAQRRPIVEDDLPQVQSGLTEYLRRLSSDEELGDFQPELGLVVERSKISADGEFSLSGERYRESSSHSSIWSMVPLGEIVDILDSLRRPITKRDRKAGPYPYYGATGILDCVEGYLFDEPLVLIGEDGAKWGPGEHSSFGVDGKVWVNNHAHVMRPKREHLLDRFLIEVLNRIDLRPYITGVTVPKLNQTKLRSIQIPLPPLEVQKEIVAEIEGYQKVIDGARAVVDNYRPQITVDPKCPTTTLGDVCSLTSGQHVNKDDYNTDAVGVGYLTGPSDFGDRYATFTKWTTKPKVMSQKGDILIAVKGSGLGKVNILDADKATIGRQLMAIRVTDAVPEYIYSQLFGMYDRIQSLGVGAAIPGITRGDVLKLEIQLPSLKEQQAIVAEIEAERALVDANRELITRFEKKIHDTINRVWVE